MYIAYNIIPIIFASSFFHSILDLRLTSLCKGGIVRLLRWEQKETTSVVITDVVFY